MGAPSNGKFGCKAPTEKGKTTDFGAKCALSCNQGFAVSGSSTYTCDTTQKFTGTGKCVQQTCAAPTVSSTMSGTDCADTMKEGQTCKATCKDGYEVQNTFKCSGGIYVTKSVCAKKGAVLKKEYF